MLQTGFCCSDVCYIDDFSDVCYIDDFSDVLHRVLDRQLLPTACVGSCGPLQCGGCMFMSVSYVDM